MSKVSVVIAAYNVENYIAETLNSVISQTLKDIDIVVVDDCSTDKTFEIISKYAELDNRIKVVRHEVNKSVNISRITGLENCSGDYVMYIDGDDTLIKNACEKAYKAITGERVDVLRFGFDIVFEDGVVDPEGAERAFRVATKTADHKMISISRAGILDEKAVGNTVDFTIWDKIYKRDVLLKAAANIPREYLNMAEDVLYSFLIQYHTRSYGYLKDDLYIYRFGCGMSTVAKSNERIILSISKNAYVYNYLKEWTKKMGAQKETARSLMRVYKQLFSHIIGTLFNRLNKDERPRFIAEVAKYCDPADIVLAFAEWIYRGHAPADEVARLCSEADIFSTKKTEAKTIGVYYFRVYNGGIENVISTLSDIWVKSGYNVVLFTDEPPHKDDYYINPAIKRVVIPKLTERDTKSLQKRIEAFRKAIIENGIDVMVYNAWVSDDLVLDEMTVKSCGVGLVIHTHNLFCSETDSEIGDVAYRYSALPSMYRLADSVITLTDVDDAWWKMLGLRSFKTINPLQFDMNVGLSPLNGHNIVFVGRISKEKQVVDAIKVAELVKESVPDVQLTVVGKGDDKDYIKSVYDYIANNDLKNVVKMAGFQSDMLPFYHQADVVLATSRYEGFGLALMESKVCGVPLVMYELPNLDITRDSKGMVVVDQSDVRAAAEAIVKILTDDDLKKQMGRDARRSVEEFYSIDLAEHWKNIFDQTLLPKPAIVPMRELPVQEVAVRIAADYYNTGIYRRKSFSGGGYMASAQDHNLVQRCAFLEEELERFRRSETYRVGRIVTFIPRLIKRILKKILGRD